MLIYIPGTKKIYIYIALWNYLIGYKYNTIINQDDAINNINRECDDAEEIKYWYLSDIWMNQERDMENKGQDLMEPNNRVGVLE